LSKAATAKENTREKVVFEDTDAFQALCGQGSARLKLLEKTAGVGLHVRGNEVTIEGQAEHVGLAKESLRQLYNFARQGRAMTDDEVVRAVKVLSDDQSTELKNIFSETVFLPKGGRAITPKGVAQKTYIDLVRQKDIVFSVGPAGTGKTYLAMAMAVRALVDKRVRRIVLTRPAIEAGEKLGFLPGSLEEKVNPYLRPLYDALFEMIENQRVQRLMDQGVIEVAPLAFMRGRTLSDSFVILDEAQNTTYEQMKMFLTRIGFGSKAIVTGDLTQSDLPRGTASGLGEALHILRDVKGIGRVDFTDTDVVRHPLVQEVIRAYTRYESADAEDGDD
jgi:phosphate starvation-inducible PhoH-like protein